MKKSIAILACAALLCGCAPKADNGNAATETEAAVENAVEAPATGGLPANGTVHELTDATLYTPGVKVSNLTVLDFNAVWCGPCQRFKPVFHKVAEEFKGKAVFVSVNTDSCPDIAQKYQIQSIPQIVTVMPDGTATAGPTGYQEEADFKAYVESVVNK